MHDALDGDGGIFVEYDILDGGHSGGVDHHIGGVDVDFEVALFVSFELSGEIGGEVDERVGISAHDVLHSLIDGIDHTDDTEALCGVEIEDQLSCERGVIFIIDDGGTFDDGLLRVGQSDEEGIDEGQEEGDKDGQECLDAEFSFIGEGLEEVEMIGKI